MLLRNWRKTDSRSAYRGVAQRIAAFVLLMAGLTSGLASLALAQPQAEWRFAHPDADFRLSVNLRAVLESPTVAAMIKKAGEGPKDQAAQVQLVLGLLSSIDRVSISARQMGGTLADVKNSDALVLVTGSFDPQVVQAFFPSTGTSQVKQVGPHAILIGEGASFTQAIERMAGKALLAPSDELAQSDIWISGTAALMSAAQPQSAPPGFQDIQAFSVGLNLGNAPELNLILTASNASGAGQLLKAFHGLLEQGAGASPMAGLLEQALQIKQEGSRVRMHFLAPPELVQFAQAQAASGQFAQQLQPLLGMLGMPGVPSATPAQKAPAPPDNGGKIVIYGLDDGPREVKTK